MRVGSYKMIYQTYTKRYRDTRVSSRRVQICQMGEEGIQFSFSSRKASFAITSYIKCNTDNTVQ